MTVRYLTDVSITGGLEVTQAPATLNGVVRVVDLEAAVKQHFKLPVRAASDTNLAGTYNATAKTLTASSAAALEIDGVTLAAADRVLLFGQTAKTQNGIYVVTVPGDGSTLWVLTRATDFDSSDKIYASVQTAVAEGVKYDNVTFILVTDDPITLDTTQLEFTTAGGVLPQVQEKTFTITGDGSAASFPLTHSFNTKNVTVTVIDDAGGYEVLTDVVRALDTVTVGFSVAPASGKTYTVLVRVYL
jgi:hypothetical protein